MSSLFYASKFNNAPLNNSLSLWASEIIFGDSSGFGPCCTMAVYDGALIGVVVYHNYHPKEGVVELSAASTTPKWLSRKVLVAMFSHAFNALDCQMVVLRIPETSHMRRMLRAYGFTIQRIERMRGRNAAEYLCTLTDDEWRARGADAGRYRYTDNPSRSSQ